MPRTLSVPDFDFADKFYYPQIFELLIAELRENVPEITNESRGEVAIQLLSAFALSAHLCVTLLDVTAHEALMVTSQLRDSLVAHLKLIGYEVAGDIPATVDVLVTLSKTFTATEDVVPALALFSTRRRSDEDPILFEAQAAQSVTRTDQVSKVWVFDASGPTYTDRTVLANNDGGTFAALPATPAAGDALYVGHDSALTDRLRVDGVATPMAGVVGVWEYSDEELLDEFPNLVTNLGITLRVEVDALLNPDGDLVDHTGLDVTVTLNSTGASESAAVQYDGANFVEVGFLGQVSPSTDERAYSVGTQWHRVPFLDDDTNNGAASLEQDGDVDFTLPQSTSRDWRPIEVNGVTAYWLRFRVISVAGPTAAVVDRLRWNRRDTYLLFEAVQGQTVVDEVLGSSDATASQSFQLGQGDVIDGTVAVSVDAQTWTEVADFLSSTAVDEHYTVEVDSDGIATVTFGDGANGKLPPAGTNNVTTTYRRGADADGNVGTDTVTVNRSGVAHVKRVTNPRPAAGWVQRRGTTAEDRERLKVEGPASLRTLGRAVTAADVEYLTTQFTTEAGTKPFVRANAIEEGFGVKTVKVVTVGPAGATTDADDRAELETYFNGDADTGESGVMVANQRVFARDYTDVPVDVTGVVTGDVAVESVENAIRGLLSPVAVRDDGINYRWDFGQTVTLSSIIAAVLRVDGVEDFTLTVPATNTTLTDEQLPSTGTLAITLAS